MTTLTARMAPAMTPLAAAKKSLQHVGIVQGSPPRGAYHGVTSCRYSPRISVFFVLNITIERSSGTGEAERVWWVYEWGAAKVSPEQRIAKQHHSLRGRLSSNPPPCGGQPDLRYDNTAVTAFWPHQPRMQSTFIHHPTVVGVGPVSWGLWCRCSFVRCIRGSAVTRRRNHLPTVVCWEKSYTPYGVP